MNCIPYFFMETKGGMNMQNLKLIDYINVNIKTDKNVKVKSELNPKSWTVYK